MDLLLVLLATHVGLAASAASADIAPALRLVEDAFALHGAGAGWLRAVRCARELGPSRCLKAFAICRGDSAVAAAARGKSLRFDLREELDRFAWEPFANESESQLDARLLRQTERIFMGRGVRMSYPGVQLDIHSRRNGTVRFDLKQDTNVSGMDEGRGRGSQWRKRFYRVMPFLLIPPLILAAILPFVLPAFMMLSMFAVLINNMAFTGSVFTLLRNNAFSDDYEKKVIYVNDGYKNEETMHMPYAPDMLAGGFSGDSDDNGGLSGVYERFPGPHDGFPGDTFSPGDFQAESLHHFDGGAHPYEQGTRAKKRRGHGHKRRPDARRPVSGGSGGAGGGAGGGGGQDGVYVGSESEMFVSETDEQIEDDAAPGPEFEEFSDFGKSFIADAQSAA